MRKITCHSCASPEVVMNESLEVDDRHYCTPCFETAFPDKAALENKKIVKHFDPTVCSQCSTDFGESILPKLAQYPLCKECQTNIKNKTFPLWVKAFLAGIAAIVVFSFFWNWKYYQAYTDLNEANEYAANGNYAKGAQMMHGVSKTIPEVEDLKSLANYYEGVALLQADKNEKALIVLTKCVDKLPPDYKIDELVLRAHIGIDFNKHDYDGFLKGCQECLAKDSTLVENWYGVASAYSCLYATKGKEEDKAKANEYMARAKQIDSTTPDNKVFYNMIAYRLATHQVITRENFIKQFPHGWTKP